ncbi:hypothetical protein SEA_DIMINIMUS_3 [Mycobacterium phage Diminimus]|nr:hypothetical protein SEA_GLASKE16_3 [Mycobacterium phage Glaske16]WNN96279.1 hypothetical protein SEA_DULCITA_3 [Mycobacterium phage Dulcita]WNO28223.1 hypothetical protein SEA_DIMINIMUS_3 [Mycobacterium phage Diminimus]
MSDTEDRVVKPQHRMCRVFGHAWDYTTVKKEGVAYIQGLICIRCSTERFLRIHSRTGETKGSRYSYADGYLFKGGGALTPTERSELRLIEVTGRNPRRRRRIS